MYNGAEPRPCLHRGERRQQLDEAGLVGSRLPPEVQHEGNEAVVAQRLRVVEQLVDSLLGVVGKGKGVGHGGVDRINFSHAPSTNERR